MIKHIVMWKFKDGEKENMKKFLEGLNSLKNIIPEIKYMETGININPKNDYDAILISEFETMDDLEKYKNTFFQYRISLYAQFTKNSFYNHLLLLQYKQKAHVQLVSFHKNYILMYIKQFHFPHISLRNPTIYDHKSPSRSS